MLNTEKKGSSLNSGLLYIYETKASKVNFNRMCQEDSENLYNLYTEEIRIFCNLEVQESEFLFLLQARRKY